VPAIPDLNPLKLNSGLFTALHHASLPRSAVDKVLAGKRKPGQTETHPDQKEISVFSMTHTSEMTSQCPSKPGDRLTVNHWSNPLTSFSKVKSLGHTSSKKRKM
ncbi:hypothetical protein PoB_006641200, partial [Plakobranchus ocellatus]